MRELYKQCHCGGHFRCGGCRRDVCFCNCTTDGAPHGADLVTDPHDSPSYTGMTAA